MQLKCPGYLFAKSLQVDGLCQPDYAVLFCHDALRHRKEFIRQIREALELSPTAHGPVLLICALDDGQSLLFRFTWSQHPDAAGRRHSRCEVLLLPSNQTADLLSKEFTLSADSVSCEFEVTDGGPSNLKICSERMLYGRRVRVLAGDDRDFRIRAESAGVTHSQGGHETGEWRRNPWDRRIQPNRPEGNSRTLARLLIGVLLLGYLPLGFYCYEARNVQQQLNDVNKRLSEERKKVETITAQLKESQGELEAIRNEKDRFERMYKSKSVVDENLGAYFVNVKSEIKESCQQGVTNRKFVVTYELQSGSSARCISNNQDEEDTPKPEAAKENQSWWN